ncbi:MAG: glycoside hydrolase family 16 protein [Oligoflexus sp.]|nr:glycoside hydrolase family 16 protein [Oligoflexus sp.]
MKLPTQTWLASTLIAGSLSLSCSKENPEKTSPRARAPYTTQGAEAANGLEFPAHYLIDAGASTTIVNLRTTALGLYLSAENQGGGIVKADRTQAREWETFRLIDKNGGQLQNGDMVYIQTLGGYFFQVLGGSSTALNAASRNPEAWEMFRVVTLNGGAVGNGSVVGFQSASNNKFLSALGGGQSLVDVHGDKFEGWERFYIDIKGDAPIAMPNNAPAKPAGWTLKWSDEFNGGALDESKWTYEVQKPFWVNAELQNYTDHRPENVRVENGNLVIEARRDFFGGEYSSGRIKTQGKASWTYGRIEARMKLPGGYGTWPAFWMMPDNASRGWPACGEIDILEEVGYDPNLIHATTHTQAYNWRSGNQRTGSTYVRGAEDGFHVYAIEWFPDHIDAFVDGNKYFTSSNDNSGDNAWPFNKNFHIILNLAVGGEWGGLKGVDSNIWPKQMLVDYVRVYQR